MGQIISKGELILTEWAKKSPRQLASIWFAVFRLFWAIYWFGFAIPGKSIFIFSLASGLLPIILSVVAARIVGYFLGSSILDSNRTKSYWIAAFKGILIQHLTTIIYLPVAIFLTCLFTNDFTHFFGLLFLSFIFSLAGIPIHTLLGAITGLLLYHLVTRKIQATNQ